MKKKHPKKKIKKNKLLTIATIANSNILELNKTYQNLEKSLYLNEELIDNMRRSLDKRPQNVLYAVLLANYEKSQGNFDAASEFYDLALSYSPDDPNLLSQYAENLFLVNDRSFNESVNQAIERAYKADSNQPIILGLMGVRAYLDNNFEEAIFFWQRGLDNTEKNDLYYQSYVDGVRKAEEKILMNQ